MSRWTYSEKAGWLTRVLPNCLKLSCQGNAIRSPAHNIHYVYFPHCIINNILQTRIKIQTISEDPPRRQLLFQTGQMWIVEGDIPIPLIVAAIYDQPF